MVATTAAVTRPISTPRVITRRTSGDTLLSVCGGTVGRVTDQPAQPSESAIDRVRRDPRLRTRDDSGMAAVVLGTLAWAVAWIVFSVTDLDDGGTARAVCLAGFILGLIGCVLVGYRRWSRARRARGASST